MKSSAELTNQAATDSAVASDIDEILASLGGEGHVPLFTGHIYYADTAQADDTGDGRSPATAKKTIGAALGLTVAGDAVTVKAGTYTETGIDLNLNALEMWCEIGTFLAPTSGVALTLSGNSCRVRGQLWVLAFGGQIGVNVTGDLAYITEVAVMNGTNGFAVSGDGSFLFDCRAGLQTVAAYNITGSRGIYDKCSTVGAGGDTYGYHINSGADIGLFLSCTSVNHGFGGFYIATLSANWTLKDCSSGAGDGPRVDVDDANVWSGYTYDDEVFHTTTFGGGGGSQDNLFQVTGSVEIQFIYGNVETVLSADVDDIYLDLWDGTVSAEITDNGGGGTDTNSADIGSLFIKTEIATSPITLMQSNQGRVEENTNWRDPRLPFLLTQKKDTDTFIRVVYSGVATSGAIHWHCRWEPITEDGFVATV